MAKTDAGGRRGASWIPMAVAVVCIAIFFGWIATREPPESVAVVEPGDTASDTTSAAANAPATVIEPDQLTQAQTARALLGQNVELTSVEVQDVLGSQMFWIGLPGGSPYLVKVDSASAAAGTALPQVGSSVRVIGRMMDKTPEVLDGWQQAGVLDADQRLLAEFGSTYIEAGRVEPAGS